MSAPAVLFAKKGGGGHGNKVTICHVPPGNPANAHTIRVGPKAAERHLSQHPGDTEGRCGNGGNGNGNGEDCDDNNNGIVSASEVEYCDDDNGNGGHHNGDNGNGNGGHHNGDNGNGNGGNGGDDRR